MIKLSSATGISEFQWSTTEKVWPFEKADDNSTLYAFKMDLGSGPNNGYKYVSLPYSISSSNKTYQIKGIMRGSGFAADIDSGGPSIGYIGVSVDTGNQRISIWSPYDYSPINLTAYILYSK